MPKEKKLWQGEGEGRVQLQEKKTEPCHYETVAWTRSLSKDCPLILDSTWRNGESGYTAREKDHLYMAALPNKKAQQTLTGWVITVYKYNGHCMITSGYDSLEDTGVWAYVQM